MNFPGNILQKIYKNFVVVKIPLVYSDENAKKKTEDISSAFKKEFWCL
ncbi:hypothetical protein HZF06_11490 [Clostridium intestinale]|uniref:Uncharacterized protein n=2 Tax=Clostridium intestinale TaxID=36845 RepID=A0A7D7A6V0_9CLOT|nr:hypothetical protein HZF06_11490 [Clostridium intestinale]